MEYNFLLNNAIIENENLTDDYKTMLSTCLTSLFYFIYNNYGLEVNFDNFLEKIKTIKIEKLNDENIDDYISYDSEQNKIEMKCSKGNNNVLFDYYKVLLQIVSQRYDEDTKRYESGLIHKSSDGKEYGTGINNMIISRIATLMSDIEDPNMKELYYDDPSGITLKDLLMKNMIDVLGFETLLSGFFNSSGSEIFYEISTTLGSQEATKEFYSSIDHYDEDRINNRKKYNKYISILKENKLNNTPTL